MGKSVAENAIPGENQANQHSKNAGPFALSLQVGDTSLHQAESSKDFFPSAVQEGKAVNTPSVATASLEIRLRMLWMIGWGQVIGSCIFLLIALIGQVLAPATHIEILSYVAIPGLVGSLLSLLLVWRGRTTLAVLGMMLTGLLCITLVVYLLGVTSLVVTIYFWPIMVAGLVGSPRYSFATAVTAALCCLGILVFAGPQSHALALSDQVALIVNLILLLTMFGLIALLNWLSASSIVTALTQAATQEVAARTQAEAATRTQALVQSIGHFRKVYEQVGQGNYQARADMSVISGNAAVAGAGLDVLAISLNTMLERLEELNTDRTRLEESTKNLIPLVKQASQGDLSQEIPQQNTLLDEVVVSINDMQRGLSTLLASVLQATSAVASAAMQGRQSAQLVATGAAQQSAQISEVSAAIEEMAVSIDQVSHNAATSNTVAQASREAAKQGALLVEQVVRGMHDLRGVTLENAKKIKRLGESTQEISEIVQLVSSIAKQTNLLALNASIEAARAGEHGRGFGVVAAEIRNLAVQATESTQRASGIVRNIQKQSMEAVISMEESTSKVVGHSELVSRAGATLNHIDIVSQETAQIIATISAAAEQQAVAALTIAQTMSQVKQIATMASQSAQELTTVLASLNTETNYLYTQLHPFKLQGKT